MGQYASDFLAHKKTASQYLPAVLFGEVNCLMKLTAG
ncbi:Uncharacterised protein [Yersinia frederiksenii]|nr:Uncharacterised protein [Yersinia frederiksenii]CQH18080.1 Uncharacterised protein [Yersinia frederiksenii]